MLSRAELMKLTDTQLDVQLEASVKLAVQTVSVPVAAAGAAESIAWLSCSADVALGRGGEACGRRAREQRGREWRESCVGVRRAQALIYVPCTLQGVAYIVRRVSGMQCGTGSVTLNGKGGRADVTARSLPRGESP